MQKRKIYNYSKVFIVVALLILMAITNFKSFFTVSNLSSILMSVSLYGIMACGMMFPMLVSGPDLSISGTAAVGAMVAVKYIVANGYTVGSFFTGFLLAMLVGAGIGIVLGALIHFFDVPSFLTTLAAQYVLFGIAQIGLVSRVICTAPDIFCALGNGRFLGFPIQVYVFLAIVLIAAFLMHGTVFGRKCYMIGGNRKSAYLCGINAGPVVIGAFGLSGLLAAVAGVILAAMNQQASASAGSGYETNVLLSCVLGGASMGEGIGSIGGAVYGAIFVGLINNCMRMMGVPSLYQTSIVGLLIIAAMGFESYFKQIANGMHWSKKKSQKGVDTREIG